MMIDESLVERVLHLRQVEKLTQQQIADALGIGRKRVRRILRVKEEPAGPIVRKMILDEYRGLIAEWYRQYPRLMAKQIYERLLSYGYKGSYMSVVRVSMEYRQKRPKVYYPLVFHPGEEAQIDWFFADLEGLGRVACFLYVLAFSRYAWGIFYPRTTFEFFLAGHVECFKRLGGLARRHRYDNLKSVVLTRNPEIRYNPQFLEFARFFGFGIHACNPYSGNEKGRVERLVRDARGFLYGETFKDMLDLNVKFQAWLQKRNETVHRTTGKTPAALCQQEHLVALPQQAYLTRRIEMTGVSPTALVECDNNKYTVPSSCVGQMAQLCIYPSHVEVWISERKVATHKRSFEKRKIIRNPLHEEKLLAITPEYRMQRIYQLMTGMDEAFGHFINAQAEDEDRQAAAYQLYTLLKTHSKGMLISAVRELNGLGTYKIKALYSLLNLPQAQEAPPVWPKDINLLNLTYKERDLNEYNPNTGTLE